MRALLYRRGWRYRVNWRAPGGRVDIAFPGMRVAILIDGCFWHGCPRHGVQPKSNREFWLKKLAANRARDERQVAALLAAGWQVLRFWEHQVRDELSAVMADIDHVLIAARLHLVDSRRGGRM